MARLYEAAKTEKEVQIYSSMNADDGKKVFPKFEEKFPGVKVVHTRASGEVLTTRVVTEKKAGQDLFDLVESNLFEVGYIIDQGYTQKYVVASAGDYPAEVKDASGAFIAARLNNDIPGINTTKLPAGVTIKTWKDLCNPALSGKIAVEQGDVVVYSAMRKILGDAEAQAVLKCIAANKPSLRSGHTDMANLLAAGELGPGRPGQHRVVGRKGGRRLPPATAGKDIARLIARTSGRTKSRAAITFPARTERSPSGPAQERGEQAHRMGPDRSDHHRRPGDRAREQAATRQRGEAAHGVDDLAGRPESDPVDGSRAGEPEGPAEVSRPEQLREDLLCEPRAASRLRQRPGVLEQHARHQIA